MSLLANATICERIDEPIEMAALSFEGLRTVSPPIDNATLLQVAGEFVAHIYEHGLCFAHVLTLDQAQAEAVFLLDYGYPGETGKGYDGARRDVSKHGLNALQGVPLALAQAIKGIQRRRYERWVLASRIEHLDWQTKSNLTAAILKRWGSHIEEIVDGRSPEELVQDCGNLIKDAAGSDETLMRWLSDSGHTARR